MSLDILTAMTKKLETAIKALSNLPNDEQEMAAQAIIDYASHDGGIHLTDEQVAEVNRRLKNPHRKHLTVAEVRNRLRHYGL